MSSVLTMLAPSWLAKAYAPPKTRAPATLAQKQDAAVNAMVSAMDATSAHAAEDMDRNDLKDVLDKTVEAVNLLAPPHRHLKYEVVDEAELIQVQVVNTDDGSIVRKIPSDDVVKLVEHLRKILSERFEVKM